jgi:hypothetical protein
LDRYLVNIVPTKKGTDKMLGLFEHGNAHP